MNRWVTPVEGLLFSEIYPLCSCGICAFFMLQRESHCGANDATSFEEKHLSPKPIETLLRFLNRPPNVQRETFLAVHDKRILI